MWEGLHALPEHCNVSWTGLVDRHSPVGHLEVATGRSLTGVNEPSSPRCRYERRGTAIVDAA